MVFIYCRVSTKRQGQEGYSYDLQEKEGINFANSVNQHYQIYKDMVSGKTGDRKYWKLFLNDISRANNNDYLFYMVNDRLGRNLIEFENFKAICIDTKIQVYDNHKKRYMRFEEEGDDLISTIEGKLSEQERKKILKRTYKGLVASWDEGKRVHTKIYGYDSSMFDNKTGKKIWKIIPVEADNIRRMYELFFHNISLHKIAETMNNEGRRKRHNKPFDYQDVSRAIKKSIYAGLTINRYGNFIESKLYEPIVSTDYFYKVLEHYPTKVTKEKRGRNPLHLGSGMLHCPYCNSGFWVYKAKEKLYYKHNADIKCGGQKLFSYLPINLMLEKAFVDAITTKPTILKIEAPKDVSSDLERFDMLIKQTEKEMENFNKAIATGNAIDYFASKVGESLKQLNSYKQSKLEIEEKYKLEIEKANKLLSDFAVSNIDEFYNLQGEEKRRKLKTVVSKVMTSLPNFKIILQDGRELEYEYKEWLQASKLYADLISKKFKEGIDISEVKTKVEKQNRKLKKEIEENR